MAQNGREAISDSLSQYVYRFTEMVDQLAEDWPSERIFLIQQLQMHVGSIGQLVQFFEQTGGTIPLSNWVFYATQSLGRLPGNTDAHPNDSMWRSEDIFSTELPSSMAAASERWLNPVTLQASHTMRTELGSGLVEGAPNVTSNYPHESEALLDLAGSENPSLAGVSDILGTEQIHNVSDESGHLPAFDTFSSQITAAEMNSGRAINSLRRRHSTTEPDDVRTKKKTRTSAYSEKEVSDAVQHFGGRISHRGLLQMHPVIGYFLATGSTCAMKQLKAIILTLRSSDTVVDGFAKATAAKIFQTLTQLETIQQSCALLRRLMLIRFVQLRDDEVNSSQFRRRQLPLAGGMKGVGKPESEVVDNLVRAAFPSTAPPHPTGSIVAWREKHTRERKSVKNRLRTAKNWQKAVQKFGLGILALIPVGGECQLQDYQFETLRDQSCSDLLDALEQKEGGYVKQVASRLTPFVQSTFGGEKKFATIRVEVIDDDALISLDSSQILGLCEAVSADEAA